MTETIKGGDVLLLVKIKPMVSLSRLDDNFIVYIMHFAYGDTLLLSA